MIASPKITPMTPQEYLAWETAQPQRYEYIDGEVFAMTGGTKPHNRIAFNLATILDEHFSAGTCEVYIADVKVQVSAAGPYHYPDVVVTCDPRDRKSNQVVQYPCLIAEVLSPSTEAYDRGGKFAQYRRLETLQEYLLIQSEQMGVECFRRHPKGLWLLQTYEPGETIVLETVGLSLTVEALYRQVRFDTEKLED